MKRPKVIILGAGAAGLAAGMKLSEAGVSTLILEGRERVGGRILTIREPHRGMPVEMGAEYVHGRPEATWEMIRRFDLRAYDVPFDHRHKVGKKLVKPPSYGGQMESAMDGLGRLRTDMSFAEYLRRYRSGREYARARRLAVDFVEGFDAADAERISAQSIAEEQEGLGNVEEETQFRLPDGYGGMIERMRESLDPRHVSIMLNKRVSEIRWRRGEVEVVCGDETFRGTRLVVTLPVGVLHIPADRPGAVRFVPEIAEKRRSAGLLGSGAVMKVMLVFREAFWEDTDRGSGAGFRDAIFAHDPRLAFPTWWTQRPMRLPLLTGWVGGPKALRVSGMGRDALLNVALESLSELCNQKKAAVARRLSGFYFLDWPADPLARGAYSYVTVGGGKARRELAASVEGTLFFAGEATDVSGQASTVAGALVSGKRVAGEVMETLG
jgi:monoamine oxidase